MGRRVGGGVGVGVNLTGGGGGGGGAQFNGNDAEFSPIAPIPGKCFKYLNLRTWPRCPSSETGSHIVTNITTYRTHPHLNAGVLQCLFIVLIFSWPHKASLCESDCCVILLT